MRSLSSDLTDPPAPVWLINSFPLALHLPAVSRFITTNYQLPRLQIPFQQPICINHLYLSQLDLANIMDKAFQKDERRIDLGCIRNVDSSISHILDKSDNVAFYRFENNSWVGLIADIGWYLEI